MNLPEKVIAALEGLVHQVVKELPKEFLEKIENVGFVVESWPTYEDLQSIKVEHARMLFGLYRGVPKTKRTTSYSSLPDKIVIFAGPILSASRSVEEAKQRIKNTVLHEIGHHFGLSDKQIYSAMGI